MITTNDLPTSKLEAMLVDMGLLGTAVEIDGESIGPAIVQLGKMNDNAPGISDSDWIVSIMCVGSNNLSNSREYDDLNALIVVTSPTDDSYSVVAEMYAKAINDALTDKDPGGTMPGYESFLGAIPAGYNGPFFSPSGRVSFEVSTSLLLCR